MPPKTKSLSAYIQDRFDGFSRSQKDVAQYIVDHLDEVAFQTAEELARRASTSSSTVVRFAQALGFEGFPELQQSARTEYRRRHEGNGNGSPPNGEANGTRPAFSLDQSPYECALSTDHANVEETARKTAAEDIEQAVKLIAGSGHVLIAGVDQLAFFASYLRYLLMLLDIRSEVVASPSQESLGRLARIGPETLVIGFSAGRANPLVLRAMKLARARKCRAIAITDATLSDVAKLSTLQLYYSSDSPSYTRSHTALLGLVQALAYGVYARDEAAYEGRIRDAGLR